MKVALRHMLLEQGPAATGKAANFGRRWTIFGGKTVLVKRTRKSKEIVPEAAEKRAQPLH